MTEVAWLVLRDSHPGPVDADEPDENGQDGRRAGKTAADSEHPSTSPQGRRERAVSVDFGSGGA